MTTEAKGLRLGAAETGLTDLAAWPPLAGPLRLLADLPIWPFDGSQTFAAPETRLVQAMG